MAEKGLLLTRKDFPNVEFHWHFIEGFDKDSAEKLAKWGEQIAQAQLAKDTPIIEKRALERIIKGLRLLHEKGFELVDAISAIEEGKES